MAGTHSISDIADTGLDARKGAARVKEQMIVVAIAFVCLVACVPTGPQVDERGRMNRTNNVSEYVGAEGLRGELFELMNGLTRTEELEWGRVVSLPDELRAAEFERIGADHGCRQVKEGERLLWLNDDDRIEAMVYFVNEPTKVQPFLDIYRMIEEMDCPLTFLIHPQLGRKGTFDAYRLSRKSYAEHSWELGLKSLLEPRELPQVRIREDLWELFHPDVDELTKAYWAWALYASPKETVAKLQRESAKYRCTQRIDGPYVLWTGEEGTLEAMFAMIADPSQVAPFRQLYEKIAATGCPLTYCFVFQPHEGERWDVHRLSPRFSYLETNWAFWRSDAQPDPAAKPADDRHHRDYRRVKTSADT